MDAERDIDYVTADHICAPSSDPSAEQELRRLRSSLTAAVAKVRRLEDSLNTAHCKLAEFQANESALTLQRDTYKNRLRELEDRVADCGEVVEDEGASRVRDKEKADD